MKITATEPAADIAARTARQARVEEARAQGLGVAEEAISEDTSCAGASLWLFTATTTPANEICFHGSDQANLDSYWVYLPFYPYYSGETWSGAVRRYWPGSESGTLDCTYTGQGPSYFTLHEPFSAWGAQTNAASCGQLAQHVTLSN